MSQSSITAAALVVAFVIFVTVRGELPVYFGALGVGPKSLEPASATQTGFGLASNLTALAPVGGGGGSVVIPGGGGPSINVGIGSGGGRVGIGVGNVGVSFPIPIPTGGGGNGGWIPGQFGGGCALYPELCGLDALPPAGFPSGYDPFGSFGGLW